jgi:hypothetical protein
MFILLMVSVDVPVLVRVIWIELTVLMVTRSKATFAGTSFTVPFVRVIAAPLALPESLTEVATIATEEFTGTVDGAVYVAASPLAVLIGATTPHAGAQGVSCCVSAQLTPLFAGSFSTVAVNCCKAVAPKSTEVGETVTEIGGGVMVKTAEADLLASVIEVAVKVTVGFAGTVAGAV